MKRDAFSEYHPAVNFLYFAVIISFSLIIQHPAYVLIGAASSLSYYLFLNGLNGAQFALRLLPVGILIALVNPLLNTQGSSVLWIVFGRPYTLEALLYGMITAAVFLTMLLWFSCYNAVMTGDKFTCLFGNLIPTLSLLLVMVLRMIPNLLKKAAQITNARKAIGRGISEKSSLKSKIQSGMAVLSSLTDWALESSVVTGDSMRARGYGCSKRTGFMVHRMRPRDWILSGMLAILTVCIALCADTSASFTPELIIAPVNPVIIVYCVLAFIPITLHIKEHIQWHISISKI